jgi:hypothetical protein
VTEGVIAQWEVGDPDQYPQSGEAGVEGIITGSELRHPLPVDGSAGNYVIS